MVVAISFLEGACCSACGGLRLRGRLLALLGGGLVRLCGGDLGAGMLGR